jgi:hypothetical protein
MARCPGCDCELAGTEKLCRSCFERRYAAMAADKTGQRRDLIITVLLAVLIVTAVALLHYFFPNTMNHLGRGVSGSILSVKVILACAGVALGIYESVKWRNAQNLLFWTVIAINVAGGILWFATGEFRWLLPGIATFLARKGWSALNERRTA